LAAAGALDGQSGSITSADLLQPRVCLPYSFIQVAIHNPAAYIHIQNKHSRGVHTTARDTAARKIAEEEEDAQMSSLQVALEDAGRVTKKQKTCSERVDACVDQLISLVLATRAQLASGAQPGAISELQKQIQKLGLEKEMNSQTKELHAAVGKLNKVRALLAHSCRSALMRLFCNTSA